MNGLIYLTYNCSGDIARYWDKMILGVSLPLHLVVIDNASVDNTVAILSKSGNKVHCNEENEGFVKGINKGISLLMDRGIDDWIFIVNPDVECPEEWDRKIVEDLQDFSKCGIVGTKLVSPFGKVLHSGGLILDKPILLKWSLIYPIGGNKNVVSNEALCVTRYVPEQKEVQEPKRCAWVTFSAVALKVDMVKQIGPLDERYFLYGSDMNYCMRAWQAGWEVWCNTIPFVHYKHDSIVSAPKRIQQLARQDMVRFADEEEPIWPHLLRDSLPKKM